VVWQVYLLMSYFIKSECWYADGGVLTGSLHVLESGWQHWHLHCLLPQQTPEWFDIMVSAYPSCLVALAAKCMLLLVLYFVNSWLSW